MIRKLKILIQLAIFSFLNMLVSSAKEIKQKSILLIRLDAIGDYVLFRNYIEELKKSKKYKDYSITLVGNRAWKGISEELDIEYIEKFIWLDRTKFVRNFRYRYHKLKEIASEGYEIILSPTYSREFFYGDAIADLVHAQEKIGSVSDLSMITLEQKKRSDRYYDHLIAADDDIMFEFERNKVFFQKLIEEKIKLNRPHLSLMPLNLPFKLPDNYAVIFIGASKDYRKWDVIKFAQIASYLKEQYHYEIVLCGGPGDKSDAEVFKNNCQFSFIDLVGKTSLVELLYVINNGNLLVSNETSAPHFAIALGIPHVFVISNGNHYGRFTPYPQNITENYHVIYHPDIEGNLANYEKLCNTYGFGSNLDINEIKFESVKNKIDEVLEKP